MFSSLKNINQLRWMLALFFIAIAVPAIVLSFYSYRQLEWEAFYLQRNNASEVSERINQQVERWLISEENRSFIDYRFLKLAGDQSSNYFTPSPLSSFPMMTELPGVIGYFQINSRGVVTTPILPDSPEQGLEYGVTLTEYSSREESFNNLLTLLIKNQLIDEDANREKLASIEAFSDDAQDMQQSDIERTFEERIKNEFAQKEKKARRYQQVDDLAIDTRLEEALVKNESQKVNQLSKDTSEKKTAKKEALAERKLSPDADRDSNSDILSSAKSPIKNRSLVRSPRIEQNFEVAESEVIKKSIVEREQSFSFQGESRNESYDLARSSDEQDLEEKSPLASSASMPASSSAIQSEDRLTLDSSAIEKTKVTVFQSEIDPFNLDLLESGHLVMYRKTWKNDQRFIQGILLDPNEFFEKSVGNIFDSTQLSTQADLVVTFDENVLKLYSHAMNSNNRSEARDSIGSAQYSKNLSGERLLKSSLIAPFNDVKLIFSVNDLDAGPGLKVVLWSSLVMGAVLAVGVWLIYLVGVRQLRLAQQQQNFVSAVSHELKTPLTSIRMYGELLKEGWATEDKKKEYYHYIFDESERLSRLISNVLQLAKMNRDEWKTELNPVSIRLFIDTVRSKIDEQVCSAGFNLEINIQNNSEEKIVFGDIDYLLQIMINLVDNAIKFSKKSEIKTIVLSVSSTDTEAVISVRDFGPGIDATQLKKIFGLFYRAENELTRETVGTGIGLALVAQLIEAMNGSISVSNTTPGAEFTIKIPLATG